MPNETKNLLDGSFNVRKAVMFVVAVLIAAVLWFLPLDAYGIEGLTVIQERVIGERHRLVAVHPLQQRIQFHA